MNVHKNARLTPRGRERMVRQVASGQTPKAVSEAAGVCPRTVRKWVERFRAEGWRVCAIAPRDRIACTGRRRRRLSTQVEALRRQRCTGKQIAARDRRLAGDRQPHPAAAWVSTGSTALEPAEPVRRYEREHPGETDPHRHQKARPLQRDRPSHHRRPHRPEQPRRGKVGWEFVHVCIDDASRIAFSQVMPDEKKAAPSPSSRPPSPTTQASASTVERVMTDNGSCYKSFAFRKACKRLGLKHIRTKPYTPKTNGKAERFIQTSLREWAYAQAYQHLRRTRRRAAHLAAPLQLAPTSRRHRKSKHPSADSA